MKRCVGALALLPLGGCGGGVITSKDVSLGEGLAIAAVVIAALLYVGWVSTRGRD